MQSISHVDSDIPEMRCAYEAARKQFSYLDRFSSCIFDRVAISKASKEKKSKSREGQRNCSCDNEELAMLVLFALFILLVLTVAHKFNGLV